MKRPRWKPNEEQAKQMETLAGYGLTEEQIANVLGVSWSTFHIAMQKDDALHARLLKGKDQGIAAVSQMAYKMAVSGKDTSMTIFWLKVRARWKDTTKLELTGENGGPIETAQESPEEKKQRLNAKIDRLKRMLSE